HAALQRDRRADTEPARLRREPARALRRLVRGLEPTAGGGADVQALTGDARPVQSWRMASFDPPGNLTDMDPIPHQREAWDVAMATWFRQGVARANRAAG